MALRLRESRVRAGAWGVRTGAEGKPSSPEGGGGHESGRVGEGETGLGAVLRRTGPLNMRG